MEVTFHDLCHILLLEARHRSFPHSKGEDYTRVCSSGGVRISGGHLRVCSPQDVSSPQDASSLFFQLNVWSFSSVTLLHSYFFFQLIFHHWSYYGWIFSFLPSYNCSCSSFIHLQLWEQSLVFSKNSAKDPFFSFFETEEGPRLLSCLTPESFLSTAAT